MSVGQGIGGAASGAAAGSAILPGIGTAIGGVAGLIGGLFSGPDYEGQMLALQQQAMDAIKNVDIPTLQQLQIQLQPYRSAGLLSPEVEQTVFSPASMMNQVAVDPRIKNAQMSALQKISDQSHSGLNASDMSSLDQIQRNSATAERGKEQQILQDAQQRGQAGGSGAALAAQLSSAQNAGNAAASQGLQVGSAATQRALEALQSSGQLATQMNSQDFSQQAQKAQAQDVINQFNTRNRQQVIGQNVQTQNQAQAANLQNAQNIMNQNTGVANQQAQWNSKAVQQNYENTLRQAQGIYSVDNSQANNMGQAQQRSNDAFSGVMSGITSAGAAYGANQNSNNLASLIKTMQGGGSGSTSSNPSPTSDDWANYTGANNAGSSDGLMGPPSPYEGY